MYKRTYTLRYVSFLRMRAVARYCGCQLGAQEKLDMSIKLKHNGVGTAVPFIGSSVPVSGSGDHPTIKHNLHATRH